MVAAGGLADQLWAFNQSGVAVPAQTAQGVKTCEPDDECVPSLLLGIQQGFLPAA